LALATLTDKNKAVRCRTYSNVCRTGNNQMNLSCIKVRDVMTKSPKTINYIVNDLEALSVRKKNIISEFLSSEVFEYKDADNLSDILKEKR
jgi:hypothetical protein